MWSFSISPLSVNPAELSVHSVVGYNPLGLTLTLSGDVAWRASVSDSNWLSIHPTGGSGSGSMTVRFETATLPVGHYSNAIAFQISGITLVVPVSVRVHPLSISKMTADRKRPYIYAMQQPLSIGESGLVHCINILTGNIEKTLTIGRNPVDLTINDAEGRLYIASWGELWTYVVDLNLQTLLPPLNLGTDVYRVNAGRLGRIVTEGRDAWVSMILVDTLNGVDLDRGLGAAGDGEFDPTGRYYYRVGYDGSGGGIAKFDTINDTFVHLTGNTDRGTLEEVRNLVMSADGSRLVWTRVIFDADLVSHGQLPDNIYALSTNGRLAFGASRVYDTLTGHLVHILPTSSTVSVVDGLNQRYWFYLDGALRSIPLSVIQAPKIAVQPRAHTAVTAGTPVSLSVVAMGLPPLSYQWTRWGTNIVGATNAILSLPSLRPEEEGPYQVIVTNAFGSVTSAVAQLTLLIPPSIVSNPVSTNVLAGRAFSLSVTAIGSQPFTYVWLFEDTVIHGTTGPMLVVTNAQAWHQGVYRVVVGNAGGAVTSAPALVRVRPTAPLIVQHPVSTLVYASSNAVLTAFGIGTQPMGYQWFFNGNLLAGARGTSLTISNVQAVHAGDYFVVVTNPLGRATSHVATLTVLPRAPYFVIQPLGASERVGSSHVFTGQANGSLPILYQWQRNGTNLVGATRTALSLTNLRLEDGGNYTLVASNIAGVTTSAVAVLTVYQVPILASGLRDLIVHRGDTVALAVEAVGSEPLIYTWHFNGSPLGVTNRVLVLTNVGFHDVGFYRVLVTNLYGSVSAGCRVSVLEHPGSLRAWGDNIAGQCDIPSNLNDIVAAAGGDFHTVALRRDGTVLAWGSNAEGQTKVPRSGVRIVAIAAGAYHNLAITERGGVVAWGRNNFGQANVPAFAWSNVLAVAAGEAHSVVLRADGTVVCWGDNSHGQAAVPQGLAGVRSIAAGRKHTLALRTNGVVVGWGYNAFGQASPPTWLTNVVAIAAGYLHSVALRSDGTVVCWGDNSYGQTNAPAGLTNGVAIAAGDFHTYARLVDGRVIGWGDNGFGQLDIPSFDTKSVAIASGCYHGLALMPPLLQIRVARVEGGFVLEWDGEGVLQWAPTVTGPYADVPGTFRSFTNADFAAPARFYRVRR
ncbi:MAG: immunoglobulin domain-containing protein [Verrucomicrobiota bacterium]|nr:immunoglobulin domain-containing protein [Limisphaera sp.]MDW8381954.1 immunoglobulin domain-containing protein [Verrucomicrobiota bacterium]